MDESDQPSPIPSTHGQPTMEWLGNVGSLALEAGAQFAWEEMKGAPWRFMNYPTPMQYSTARSAIGLAAMMASPGATKLTELGFVGLMAVDWALDLNYYGNRLINFLSGSNAAVNRNGLHHIEGMGSSQLTRNAMRMASGPINHIMAMGDAYDTPYLNQLSRGSRQTQKFARKKRKKKTTQSLPRPIKKLAKDVIKAVVPRLTRVATEQ